MRNGRSVVVRINDRLRHRGAIIDVAAGAARQIGLTRSGRVPVRLTILSRGDA
jgi:rare lipoprotein A